MINSAHRSNGAHHLLPDNYKVRKKQGDVVKQSQMGGCDGGCVRLGSGTEEAVGSRQTRCPTLLLGAGLRGHGQEKPIYMVTFS